MSTLSGEAKAGAEAYGVVIVSCQPLRPDDEITRYVGATISTWSVLEMEIESVLLILKIQFNQRNSAQSKIKLLLRQLNKENFSPEIIQKIEDIRLNDYRNRIAHDRFVLHKFKFIQIHAETGEGTEISVAQLKDIISQIDSWISKIRVLQSLIAKELIERTLRSRNA
ncbi:MAG: hypothetical protein U1E46_09745 [Hyphomicrobiales bacterium]